MSSDYLDICICDRTYNGIISLSFQYFSKLLENGVFVRDFGTHQEKILLDGLGTYIIQLSY
jgi:hypothetical protein